MADSEHNLPSIFGVATLDDQHRRFVAAAGEILGAIKAGMEPKQMVTLLSKLREYTVYHFNDEEAFLRSVEYPELKAHCQQHAEIKRLARYHQDRLFKKKQADDKDLRQFLKLLLVDHVIHCDLKVRRFLENRKA